ncbi:hypothetical protein P5P86_06575 [Nocardioides sp. BP30]|uniref:hypothetical protein n=1 Tax=Nocardioides sp. BP30 TaxID=3036374 RepID=UPI002468F112|nr:hypothetical protein [Nocardioides sp. BP30]WGL53493.1 hypothetical protein P5P86_06575 [Nocardioides sp. BP30]
MEISTVPHRRAASARGWLVAGGLVIVVAVVLLGVQALLGVQPSVVAGHDLAGKADRGTLLLSTQAAVGQLRVGDVITFRPPAPYDRGVRVTREVEARDLLGALTASDAGVDPWQLPTSGPDVERAVVRVAYLGYPFLGSGSLLERVLLPVVPVMVIAAAVLIAAGRTRRRRTPRRAA